MSLWKHWDGGNIQAEKNRQHSIGKIQMELTWSAIIGSALASAPSRNPSRITTNLDCSEGAAVSPKAR